MWKVSGTVPPSPSSRNTPHPIKLTLKFLFLSPLVPSKGRTPFWALEPESEHKHPCLSHRWVCPSER